MPDDKPQSLKCPACGSFFRAEDLHATRGFLTCSYCRALMPWRVESATRATSSSVRPPVPLPARFTLEEVGSGLRIRRRWFRPHFLFLAFFCVIWDGFLVFWYSNAVAGGVPTVAVLFPMLHVAVGIGLTYFTLAGFVNTTTIEVGPNELRVGHAPLPWFHTARLDPTQIDQLYAKERVHHGKNGTSTSYEVWVALRGGSPKKILSGLDDTEQALFVEQRVEMALGLADRPMATELPR